MSSHVLDKGPHFKFTVVRPQTPEDLKQAENIVQTLRRTLEKYKEYRVAMEDGYKPFLPKLPLEEYHFTNTWYGFLEAFRFDPAYPTSLLYKKTLNGYELVGAMYTASKYTQESDLDKRIPLSVARWRQHVNICLPPRGKGQDADWTKFGPRGSVSTQQECAQAGGRFMPVLFGWMVHVYPYEQTRDKIWAR